MAQFAIKRTLPEGWTYVVEPKGAFLEYGQELFAGDAGRVEVGYVDILWDYGDEPITGLEMAVFFRFCTGASATVYVRTKTREVTTTGQPVFRAYEAEMYRPDTEFHSRHGSQWFTNVKVRFRGWTEVSAD